jgi:hypothetical protein
MSKLSRRALVASASSLPALAIPAASLAAPADPRDRQAVVARAEQMVEILRDRFVCAGWHEQFDTNRAAAFLGAVRQEDYNSDYRDAAGEFVHAWMIDHGQSFDWLYLGNPAGLIAGAAHYAFPMSSTAQGDDPIFAAIEAHQRAWAEYCQKCSAIDDADTEPNRELVRLDQAVDDAAGGLLDVMPTTIGGVSALLTYAADHACGGNTWPEGYVDENPKTAWDRVHGVSWEVFLHKSLARALPKIAETMR